MVHQDLRTYCFLLYNRNVDCGVLFIRITQIHVINVYSLTEVAIMEILSVFIFNSVLYYYPIKYENVENLMTDSFWN